METTIVSNQVECLKCGDKPYSSSGHDFKWCKCGAIAVDGGTNYLRRVGDMSVYKELSIELPTDLVDKLIPAVDRALQWAEETGRNPRGTLYAILRAIRDSGACVTPVGDKVVSSEEV